jgi:hypothetical protein
MATASASETIGESAFGVMTLCSEDMLFAVVM